MISFNANCDNEIDVSLEIVGNAGKSSPLFPTILNFDFPHDIVAL